MTPLDPVAEFNTFLRNSRAHAAFWLQHGYLHPEAHHIIVARLTPWIERVTAAGAEILDKLRARCLPSKVCADMGILGHSAERRRKQRQVSQIEMQVLAPQDPSISAKVWTYFEQTATPVAPQEQATPKPRQETSFFAPIEISPIPDWACAPAIPENPDPKRLRWDETKRAFRLIDPPTRCDCAKSKSAFGEKLICGLCDGYARPPKRFQDGASRPTCVYCGERVLVSPGEKRICKRCQTLKARVLASGVTGDNQILLAIHRALSATDRRERSEDEVEALRKTHKANLRRTQRRWEKRKAKPGVRVEAEAEELAAE